MGDNDRWRDERDRPRGTSERGEQDYRDRYQRGEGRGGYGDQQSGRDFRGDREPGATDLAFGQGLGRGYSGRDYSGRDDERQQSDRYRGYGGRDEGYRNDAFERRRGEADATGYRGERGFFERAGDEMASWFGDDDASHRRRQDAQHGDQGAQHHAGKGPRNYQRSDERIREDINDRLTDDRGVDATDVEVAVQDREVTLSGTVTDRLAKRRAEDIAEAVSGVSHVQNNLRVRQVGAPAGTASGSDQSTASTQAATGFGPSLDKNT